jgi:formylglycine-generating enzyme required for sulfatase activity
MLLASAVALVLAAAPAIAQQRQPAGPAGPARPAAPAQSPEPLEVRFWNAIKDSSAASDFQTYLDAFPNGRFVAPARERLQQLQAGSAPPAPTAAPAAPGQSSPRTLSLGNAPPLRDCGECPELVPLAAGQFAMGSSEHFPFEAPVHQVTLRKPFVIGRYEVTYDEWDACVKDGGCKFSPDDRGGGRGRRPVTGLSWTDTQEYLAWLSRKTGKTYRLPTESEWEYAARGGATTAYPWGKAMEKNRANCGGCNAENTMNTLPVGSFPPNDFGLFDMMGNAAEWVADCWYDSFRGAPTDGSAWDKPRCQERVLRGGAYNNDSKLVRSSYRFKYDYDVRFQSNGFRVARDN